MYIWCTISTHKISLRNDLSQKCQNLAEYGELNLFTVHYFKFQILAFFVQSKICGVSSWDIFMIEYTILYI
jgi:hypothetical protein